jgi:hypothetical protein
MHHIAQPALDEVCFDTLDAYIGAAASVSISRLRGSSRRSCKETLRTRPEARCNKARTACSP